MRLNAIYLALISSACAVQLPAVATQYHRPDRDDVCRLGCDWDVHLTTVRSWGPFIGAHFAAHPHSGRSFLRRASLGTGIHLESADLLRDFALELGLEAGIGDPNEQARDRAGFYLGALSHVLYRIWGDADARPAV